MIQTIDFGGFLFIGILQTNALGDCPLIGIVQSIDFGDCLHELEFSRKFDFEDHLLIWDWGDQ